MYKLYEKVPKSEEFEYGMKMVEEDRNPFKEGPCLLSIVAITMFEREINGALGLGMSALRLQNINKEAEKEEKIKIENFEGSILSLSYGEPSEEIGKKGRKITSPISRREDLDDEFTKKYLNPLIEENGKKIDVLQAMKNLRNVNIMAYCGASESVLRIEECLLNRMKEIGYSESEINQILEQMCVVSYGTNVFRKAEFDEKREIKCTHFSFGDVNDADVNALPNLKNAVQKEKTMQMLGYYFNYGTGEHSAKYYVNKNDSLSVGIATVITKAMNNSVLNHKNENFIPLNKDILIKNMEVIIDGLKVGKTKEELSCLIDRDINYGEKNKKEQNKLLEEKNHTL